MTDFDVECLYCGNTGVFNRFDAQLNIKPKCYRCGERVMLRLKEKQTEAKKRDAFGYNTNSPSKSDSETSDVFGYRFDPIAPPKEETVEKIEEKVELEEIEETKKINFFPDGNDPEWFYYSGE